jgi:hypothetical protein
VYLGITLAYVLAVGVGGGIGLLFGKIGGSGGGGAGIGGLIGFGIVSGILYWARQYLLYLVKAGHVAVLVELLDGQQIPAGKGQIDYATNIVKQHFATSSILFGLHQLIRGILRLFNRVTVSIASWLPIPGLDILVKLVDAVINTSLTHFDLVILRRSCAARPAATKTLGDRARQHGAVRRTTRALKNAAFLTS